ncbi:unnamed protein product [Leptidea sinapis]|uniref:BLOC-1-related complex subunit 5 n=1 Tax=Leptidea sinapis TaxID=189913 RepID=A0A5E4QWB4_9NEOP|nr:unnamed protein product [Leptidea sinapis]
MGSEQSVQPRRQTQRAPPVRRGHTIAGTNFADSPKHKARSNRPVLQQRQHSQPRHQRTKDIVVVKQAADPLLDEDIRRLQSLADITELNQLLPVHRRLEPFVWSVPGAS